MMAAEGEFALAVRAFKVGMADIAKGLVMTYACVNLLEALAVTT